MRVLVTAASRHSATTEIAQAIASTLEHAGLEVEVRRPDEIVDLTRYDAVVVGSAIYAGHWLEPAKDLIDRTASLLSTKPVWLFSTGPIGDPLKPGELPVDVAAMLERSRAREHRLFGGRLDRRDLGIGERAIVRIVGIADGDYRPWAEITAWAEEIAGVLKTGATTPQPV